MPENVAVQLDIGNLPANALATLKLTQGLLKAVSPDNVNPLAVAQIQALGACFSSNGPWAAKLPDLLTRAPSMRLERLSNWVGWMKGDTASSMSETAGGRTASLICLALGSIFQKDECGTILYEVSKKVLPADAQNSSAAQLAEVCCCLEQKLNSLGFGNLLATELTRLRQSFFESDSTVPTDLADTPTVETICKFFIDLHQALRIENATLRYSGSKAAGIFISITQCICPDDVRIEVDGKIIASGQRDSITFSVSKSPTSPRASDFWIESNMFNKPLIEGLRRLADLNVFKFPSN
jgi:hypothetical protein